MEAFIQGYCCRTPRWACDLLHMPHSLFLGSQSLAFTLIFVLVDFQKHWQVHRFGMQTQISTNNPLTPSAVAHLQQLHDEDQWLGGSHQLIQLWETSGVVVEHVSHATHMPLALQRVFPLSNEPHSFGHDRIQACVLQK